MATATIEMAMPGLSGFTLTFELFAYQEDTSAATIGTTVEATNRGGGVFTGTTTAALTGLHYIEALEGSTFRASGYVWMTDTATIHTVQGSPSDAEWTNGGRLDALLDDASGDTGSGARTITVTVDDGSTALENAKVRYTEGANTFTDDTDASGNITFNLDDATYTVSITKDGYTYAGTTHVVSGNSTPTYSMTIVTITPPADPALSSLSFWCRDENGADEEDVVVYAEMTLTPSGSTANAFDSKYATATSDATGLATLTVVRQATYKIRRGNGPWVHGFVIPDSATSTVNSIIGEDE